MLEGQLAHKPDDLDVGESELGARPPARSGGRCNRRGRQISNRRARFLAAEFLRQPKNASVLNALAWAYCYLGDREKALTYVQKAIGLSTSAGSRYEDTQMRIWAYFGDRERAIPALERLQKMPSGYYTPAMLRLDPIFDKLRGDPRFEALGRRRRKDELSRCPKRRLPASRR